MSLIEKPLAENTAVFLKTSKELLARMRDASIWDELNVVYEPEQVRVRPSEFEKQEQRRQYRQNYRMSDAAILKRKEYYNDPVVIEKRKEYSTKPEVIDRKKILAKSRRLMLKLFIQKYPEIAHTLKSDCIQAVEKETLLPTTENDDNEHNGKYDTNTIDRAVDAATKESSPTEPPRKRRRKTSVQKEKSVSGDSKHEANQE
jgi:hypothetical protein